MISNQLLNDIIAKNLSEQMLLLEEISNYFSECKLVEKILVRGSIADGDSDRMSDVDVMLIINDGYYTQFMFLIDELLRQRFSLVFDGWVDSIVPNFGGKGLVYLINYHSKIMQVDIYCAPSDVSVDNIIARTGATVLFENMLLFDGGDDLSTISLDMGELEEFVDTEDLENTYYKYLREICILIFLINKRVKRRQKYIIYREIYLLLESIKNLIRSHTDVKYIEYGWYKLERIENLSKKGKQCMQILLKLIQSNYIYGSSSLKNMLYDVIHILKIINPECYSKYSENLDIYIKKMGIDLEINS